MRRYDEAPLETVTRLPSGALRIPARLSRPGVQAYRQPDGSIRREYRPPEEVFAEPVLDALRAAPVTLGHPPEVRADNWRDVAVGHVGDDVRASEDRRFTIGSVVVSDADAIRRVDAREASEVSVGYDVDLEMTAGVSPEGEAYDAIQRRIRPNHVALVQRGRAGREVALRLDADDNEEIPSMNPTKITIAGREDVAGSPEANAAIADLARRADAADRERTRQIRASAKRLGVEVRADADDMSVMQNAIAKLAPDVDLTGASPDFIAGAFAVVVAMAIKAMEGAAAEKPKPATAPGESGASAAASDAAAARADAIDATRASAKREDAKREDAVDGETSDTIRDRIHAQRARQAFVGL